MQLCHHHFIHCFCIVLSIAWGIGVSLYIIQSGAEIEGPFSVALPVASDPLVSEGTRSDVANELRNARSRALIATKIQTKAAGGEVQRRKLLLIAEQ